MKCRVNPDLLAGIKTILMIILCFIAAMAVVVIITSFIASIIYFLIITFDMYELAAYLMPEKSTVFYETLTDYLIECSLNGVLMLWIWSILGTVAFITLYGIFHEIRESIRWKSRDLEYKFEGIKQPWYRVLLSYIIVCDKTK